MAEATGATSTIASADAKSLTFYVKINGRDRAFAMSEKSSSSLKQLQNRIHMIYKHLYKGDAELHKPFKLSKKVQPPHSEPLLIDLSENEFTVGEILKSDELLYVDGSASAPVAAPKRKKAGGAEGEVKAPAAKKVKIEAAKAPTLPAVAKKVPPARDLESGDESPSEAEHSEEEIDEPAD